MPSHFKSIMDRLSEIASTPGKKDKRALIAKHLGVCEYFAEACRMALDPSMRYYATELTSDGRPAGILSSEGDKDGHFIAVMATLNGMAKRGLSGTQAQGALLDAIYGDPDALMVVNLILKKDLRIGAGVDSFNAARKNFVPVFKVMLAHKYEERHIKKWPVAVEPKLDGVRCIAVGNPDDGFTFYTRTGKEMPAVSHLSAHLVDICEANEIDEGMVFDGELISGDNFNDTSGSVRRKSQKANDAVFTVFDAIDMADWLAGDEIKIASVSRRVVLENIMARAEEGPVKAITQYIASSDAEVQTMFNNVFEAGGEGVIVKPLDAHYHKKRNRAWLKIKGEETVDCPIIGFERGTGKYENTLGALIVDYKGVEVRVSGMSDKDRDVFWNNQEQFEGVMIEVEYHEETPDGSLRHPRYKRLREDKPVADGVGV